VNRAEWALYEKVAAVEPIITGGDLEAIRPRNGIRLLCRGYNINGGANVRIWLDSRLLIGVQHDDREIVWREQWSTSALYPSKRAYREDTDLLFATLMRERHEYPLSFTTWRD
jgi:hypothetical protein